MVMYTCELRAIGVRGRETQGSLGITGHQPSYKFSYRSYLRGIKPLDIFLQILHIYTHMFMHRNTHKYTNVHEHRVYRDTHTHKHTT